MFAEDLDRAVGGIPPSGTFDPAEARTEVVTPIEILCAMPVDEGRGEDHFRLKLVERPAPAYTLVQAWTEAETKFFLAGYAEEVDECRLDASVTGHDRQLALWWDEFLLPRLRDPRLGLVFCLWFAGFTGGSTTALWWPRLESLSQSPIVMLVVVMMISLGLFASAGLVIRREYEKRRSR